jgi:N6-adenosine-specific RNA methylase IME4
MLRQEVKRLRRAQREVELAGKIEHAAATLNGGGELYGVILADPPWKFEPYSQETGMDRSAENHYPTMSLEALSAMTPPAAEDCALFLWATTPMLLDALDLLAAWDFSYRTHWVWIKPRPGTGYWNRSCHELLLLGIRGRVPAPAPGDQYDSVFDAATEAHSTKPAAAAEMIEAMFPSAKLLEMFARAPRLGWTVWGAEAGGEQIAADSAAASGLFESATAGEGRAA